MTGRLIGVVGPSGAGKDSVMAGLSAHGFGLVRRVITRDPHLGGEDFEPITLAAFARRKLAGAFCVDWQAHGLRYGIPSDVVTRVAAGEQLLVNLSRNVLSDVAAAVPGFVALNITATPETLARRLSDRGRETAEDIAQRLARSVRPFPKDLPVIHVSNDGDLDDTVADALAQLQPVRA